MNAGAYALATYSADGRTPRAGIVVDEQMLDAAALLGREAGPMTVLELLQEWSANHPKLRRAAQAQRGGGVGTGSMDAVVSAAARPLASVKIRAPVLYPGVIFCAGANYKDHVAEMSKALNLPVERDPHELGLKPWHFIKPSAACVRGTGEAIALPAYSKKVDWEAEIAVVIGRECRNVSIERALDYVAGLSIVNDLSARDHLRRAGVAPDSPFHFDWVSQKSFDGALPFGPWIVPLEFLAGVAELPIKLWVNDELMQDSSSANLIFSMAEQIAHLSTRLTLRPGDVIATGTPAGCGSARGQFLKAGDRVRLWVGGIGELVNDFTTPAQPQAETL